MATREQGAWSISNKMEPNFDGGLIHNDFIQGTLFIKMTKAQRNNIPYLSRSLDSENTTACLVVSEGTIYKLINNPVSNTTIDTDWDSALSIATSSTQPIGQWDISNTNPVLQDTDAAGINGKFYYVTGAPTPTDVTYPGLFLGLTTQLINDDWIMSVGTHFIRVRNTTQWENLNRPQVIIDYENGTVIGHAHSINNITNLATTLASKWDDNKLASLVLDFIDVPDASIPNVAFLRQHFYDKLNTYTRSEVDSLLAAVGSKIKTYTWDWSEAIDVGGTHVDFVLTTGVTAPNEVADAASCILWIGNALQTNNFTIETTNFTNDTIRVATSIGSNSAGTEIFLSYNRASGISLNSNIINYDNSTSGLVADNVKDAIDEIDSRVDTVEANVQISEATVQLSQSQIQALNTTPITVVAAPGANKIIEIISCIVVNNYNTSAFAVATLIRLKDATLGNIRLNSSGSFVQATAKRVEQLAHVSTPVEIGANEALVVEADADATGGDASSTIDIIVKYKIVDV